MGMAAILTFDVGTTSVKTCLFDERFRLLQSASEEYKLLTPAPGIVEMDPGRYYEALCRGARGAMDACPGADVAVLAITTQGETLIPVDRDGEALGNAIVWLDARAEAQAQKLKQALPADGFYRTTGLPEINGAMPLAKLMHLREEAPSLYQRAARFLLLEDYLIARLTGRQVSEPSLLSSTGYYDITKNRYDRGILEAAGLDGGKLPEMTGCGSLAGKLTARAAADTGLKQGTPVAATAMDQISGMIGAGNVREGVVTETTGTCLTVATTLDAPDFGHPARPCLYRHFDDAFACLTYSPTAAIVLKWFRGEFLPDLGYPALDGMAANVPPGSDGVLLLPDFAGRVAPEPDASARGAFLGLGLNATRAHLTRAILEGVAFMLRENIECLARLGVVPGHVRALGGGARSALWSQIKADVTGLPVRTMEAEETASLGAAVLGAVAAGIHPDVRSACDRFVAPRAEFAPNPQNRSVYGEGYARYQKAVAALRGLYA
jgi:xylulokinase